MNIANSLDTITTTLKGVMGLGMALAVAFLVVDLLFPGTTNIVGNVSKMVTSFTSQGLVGLIALLVFVTIMQSDK